MTTTIVGMLVLLQALAPTLPVQVTFSEVPVPWYAEADVWVAIGTIALALITGMLARYTYLLFKAAQTARVDSLNAISVSKCSMEHSLRAYVVLSKIEITLPVGMSHLPIRFRVVFMNTGQTPAFETVLKLSVGTNVISESGLPPIYSHERSVKRMKGVMGHQQSVEVDIWLDQGFLESHSSALHNCSEELQVRGTLEYRDVITKSTRETNFNWLWRADRGEFFPNDTVGNNIN